MNTIHLLFGDGEQLSMLQMSGRAFVMFFITLLLIRIGGMRIFGKKSTMDTIVIIMLGAILARGVVGASPFFSTVAAATVVVLVDRLLAALCIRWGKVASIIKGEPLLLYTNGEIIWQHMRIASLSKADLLESLRLETHMDTLEGVLQAQMETNGRISFVLKK
ncbi:MAG: DUF421 domain-containing protein [Chitinophaga sp.]|uniref:DUF421 domain-containing protein n=1 Tax=Chitinophaga sp. TaxID=1869181 RepID=UPI001B1F808E|nr:YetF domain-containing protein [Chitinophaga sp.]MBO9730317.1 DUF421 domain-containing protein [Chitinophaga sp.]